MYVLFVTGNKVESSLSMSFLRADQSEIQTATVDTKNAQVYA